MKDRNRSEDAVVMAGTGKGLQINLEVWNRILQENGMQLNKSKTKVTVIGDEQEELKIKIGDITLQQVKTFQYLGVPIENNGKQEIEINNIIEKTLKLYYAMNNCFMNKKEISTTAENNCVQDNIPTDPNVWQLQV